MEATDEAVDTVPAAEERENWLLLMDPAWERKPEDNEPPVESIVGVWPVGPDGEVGKFRSNPAYQPIDEEAPTDPIDSLLRRLTEEETKPEQLQLLLRDSLFDVAMNGDGRPLVIESPDRVPCVVVTTAELHRRRVASPGWRRIDLEELADLLPENVDMLINPGGPAPVRLVADFVHAGLDMTDEQVAEAYEAFGTPDNVEPMLHFDLDAEPVDEQAGDVDDEDVDEFVEVDGEFVAEPAGEAGIPATTAAVSTVVTAHLPEPVVAPETEVTAETPGEAGERRPGMRRKARAGGEQAGATTSQ